MQVVTGDLVNVSQPTVCRVVRCVSRIIASSLFPQLVKFPVSAGNFDRVICEFYRIAKFPGVTGCIDCTHVRIKAPGGPHGEVYRNRKGYFSINVQAITGPQLQFFDIVASWPGSVHDSHIFDNSRARLMYETQRVLGLFLGDAGYPCMSFLMTPLTSPGISGSPEGRYQAAHNKTRNTVERAFCVWKHCFLCRDIRLQHRVERAVEITACAALHNLACLWRDPCPPGVTGAVAHPVRERRQQPNLLPLLPVDTLTGTRCRSILIARCFQ